MTNVWWPTTIPIDTLGAPDYSLGTWCTVDDVPQLYGLPQEDHDEHIKRYLEYFIKNGITNPSFFVFFFSHTL